MCVMSDVRGALHALVGTVHATGRWVRLCGAQRSAARRMARCEGVARCARIGCCLLQGRLLRPRLTCTSSGVAFRLFIGSYLPIYKVCTCRDGQGTSGTLLRRSSTHPIKDPAVCAQSSPAGWFAAKPPPLVGEHYGAAQGFTLAAAGTCTGAMPWRAGAAPIRCSQGHVQASLNCTGGKAFLCSNTTASATVAPLLPTAQRRQPVHR